LESGQALLDALEFLHSDAHPAPSADTPWLLKLEPGVFHVGDTGILTVEHADIEGSRRGVTRIVGTVDSSVLGAVTMFGDRKLLHLTVEHP
jgi:hypothetical protein